MMTETEQRHAAPVALTAGEAAMLKLDLGYGTGYGMPRVALRA